MAQLTSDVPVQQMASQSVYQDKTGYIVYLEAVHVQTIHSQQGALRCQIA